MRFTLILFSWLSFLVNDTNDCFDCKQEKDYLCAANTLPINSRICIDISEVPTFHYKDFLSAIAEKHGTTSEEFISLLPDFGIWSELLPHLNQLEIREKFLESDDLALMPLVGITLKQAELFCEWRTQEFQAFLDDMPKNSRADFPKKFVFRLPTAAEWGRMRFLYQDAKMMKRLEKIASGNRSAFKSKKSSDMKQLKKLNDIYFNQHTPVGFFNLHDNVAEMTSEPGIAMGGSYYEVNSEKDFQKVFNYDGPQAWLGLRCVFEIIE